MAATPTIEVKPSKLNFSVRRGSTLRRTITWYSVPVWLDAEETELDTDNSTPVDLTGYTARMQVRDCKTEEQVLELTTENGGLTLGNADGTITFFVSDADTNLTQSDRCLYDLELVAPGGDVAPLLAGTFLFKDQVTT
jgi:hypothetical protein